MHKQFHRAKFLHFNDRNLKVIEKPGKSSYLQINSYRPISLISTIVKTYENVIYNRMQYALSNDDNHTFDTFTENNYAYRKNNGVQDAYREFNDVLEQYRNVEPDKESKELAVVSIDLQSAFDTIEWEYIFKTLKKMNMPEAIINAIRQLYTSCLLYTSPSPRDVEESRMPSSA